MTTEGVTEVWVPAGRVVAILAHYKGIVEHLTARTARKISLLRSGDQEFVSLPVVDEMLCELDLVEWLMLPADQGGLADIYFDGKQYGKPNRSRPKYGTDEERLDARREQWRRKERRKRQDTVEVTCPRCSTARTVGKYYAKKMRPGTVCAKCAASDVGRLWIEHARDHIRKAA